MTDTSVTPTPEEIAATEAATALAAETAATEAAAATQAAEVAGEAAAKEGAEELSPEALRELVTKANAEAANSRIKAKELATRFEGAKTPEEVETIVADLKVENEKLARQLLVTGVASAHKLPADLAAVLTGDDEAALNAHAEVLKKYIPVAKREPASLSGGLTPDADIETLDPRALAEKARPKRR